MQLIYPDGSQSEITPSEAGTWIVDAKPVAADIHRVSENELHVILAGVSYRAFVEKLDAKSQELVLIINGERIALRAKGRYEELLKSLGMADMASSKAKDLKAPMPGLVLDVAVEEGQEVKAGDTLLILEAMKMENVIKASADGVVKSVRVNIKDSVEKGQVLIGF